MDKVGDTDMLKNIVRGELEFVSDELHEYTALTVRQTSIFKTVCKFEFLRQIELLKQFNQGDVY
jgi:hypothetical protein